MNNIVIAIEGMDGVGKSTIAKMIANDFKMKYIEKPLTNLFDIPKLKGKDNLSLISNNIYNLDDERIKACFFGLGNIYSVLFNQNEDIVIDRHFVSNYFWNGTERSEIIFKSMIDLVGKPDITILLYASVNTRMERLYIRNQNDYDLTDPEKKVLGYDKMLDFLDKYELPYILIDTEGKTIEEVYSEVYKVVSSLRENYKVKKLVK